MLDELHRVAETGERAGLAPAAADIRRRAGRRRQRRRVLARSAAVVVVAAVVTVIALSNTGSSDQHVKTAGPPVRVGGAVVANHGSLTSLSFVSARVGYALDGEWLARTDDGGKTWHRIGARALAGLPSIRFADPSVGYAWEAGGLLVTLDGGTTWRSVDVPDQIFDLRANNGVTQVLVGCPDGSCNESLWSLHGGAATLVNQLDFHGRAGTIALNASHGAPTYVLTWDGRQSEFLWVDSQPNNVATLPDPCPADATFEQLANRASANAWLACGTKVYRSADLRHWQLAMDKPAVVPLSGLVATDDHHACVAGRGLSCTNDGGRTWRLAVPMGSGPTEVTGIVGSPEVWAVADHALWYSPDTERWVRV